MKALSILQPYAWLIATGHKDIENRTWPTRFRGRFAIHAGKSTSRLKDHLPTAVCAPMKHELVFGAIIGTVELIDCVDRSDSPWFDGPFGFVLRDPVLFDKPIPYRGRLGFFNVDEGLWT